MKKYFKIIFYSLVLSISVILSIIFIQISVDFKTKINVLYQEKSNTNYEVYKIDGYYNNDYKGYDRDKIDYIKFNFDYKNIFNDYTNGYYKYNINTKLIIKDEYDEEISVNTYQILDDKVSLLDKVDINYINISDSFTVDYKKYLDELNSYDNNIYAYLKVRVNFYESLNFYSLESENNYLSYINIIIPLTDELVKIDINEIENTSKFSEYSHKEDVNIILLVIGIFFLAVSVTCLIMIVRLFKVLINKKIMFNNKVKNIVLYNDKIRKTKAINKNNKNIIYMNKYDELIKLANKYDLVIKYNIDNRQNECHFYIDYLDTLWIYVLK